MSESMRVQKFNRMIQRDLGELFQQESKRLFGIPFITVTAAKVAPDLSIAKIYLSPFVEEKKKELINEINLRKSELRGMLGNRIGKQIRKIPELIFYLDDTAENASKMDKLIGGLDIPDDDKDYKLDGYSPE
ncbi:MAG: 30S ribosome-binding factor RbfA [Bacteroidota bacterium]